MAAALVVVSGAQAAELAGATVRDRSGWSASLFVAPPPDRGNYSEAAAPPVMPPIVNATVSRRLSKSLRLSLDVTNVFDRQPPGDNFILPPAEHRGLRIGIRKTF